MLDGKVRLDRPAVGQFEFVFVGVGNQALPFIFQQRVRDDDLVFGQHRFPAFGNIDVARIVPLLADLFQIGQCKQIGQSSGCFRERIGSKLQKLVKLPLMEDNHFFFLAGQRGVQQLTAENAAPGRQNEKDFAKSAALRFVNRNAIGQFQ